MTKIIGRRTGSNRSAATGTTETVPIDSIRPAKRRTRTHSGYKRQIVTDSIREQGMLDPVTVNADGVIIDGHLRWEIACKEGHKTIQVHRIVHLSEPEERAYALAANKLPSVASYDEKALRLELKEIRYEQPSLKIEYTGFTAGQIDRIDNRHLEGLYNDLDEPRGAPPRTEPPIAQRGDLYACGPHRIYCGDSLKSASFEILMAEEKAGAAFLDPPYNVPVNGHVSGSGKFPEFAMASGEMSRSEFEEFLRVSLGNVNGSLRDGAISFVCMDHAHMGELLNVGDEIFDSRPNICVWDKGQGGMGSFYRSQSEMIAVFKKGKVPHLNNVALGKNGRDRTNVWSFPGMVGFGKGRKKALETHPTIKPVALVGEALLDVTAPGDLVLDAFGGSGSTMIAAERIGRVARLIEYDPVMLTVPSRAGKP